MKNIFVKIANVQRFYTPMKEAEAVNGDPVLIVVHGQAGRGKTTVAKWYAAQEGAVYLRALTGWTENWMLQDLCRELSIEPIPKTKKPAFEAIINSLLENPRSVIIDEADKLGDTLLSWIRDLADLTLVPFALVGEKKVMHLMQRERRIWSRTLHAVEFLPIISKDILFFAKEACGFMLTAGQAEILREASDGDFRLVVGDLRRLEKLVAVNKPGKISDEMVKVAVKQGLKGK